MATSNETTLCAMKLHVQNTPKLALPRFVPQGAGYSDAASHRTVPGPTVRAFAGLGAGTAPGPDESPTGLHPERLMRDTDFVFLQQAYRSSGGLAHGDELAARLHVEGAGGYARLARWIVGRQVFSFAWHGHFWLPMFQFEPGELAPRQGLHHVLAELVTVMDGPALAEWFALPNDALQGQSPVDMLARHGPEVHQAARMQRYVVKG
jgi:hypothetical protein